jgi:hypothetical protein
VTRRISRLENPPSPQNLTFSRKQQSQIFMNNLICLYNARHITYAIRQSKPSKQSRYQLPLYSRHHHISQNRNPKPTARPDFRTPNQLPVEFQSPAAQALLRIEECCILPGHDAMRGYLLTSDVSPAPGRRRDALQHATTSNGEQEQCFINI